MDIPRLEEIEAAKIRRDYLSYIQEIFPEVEDGKDYIANHHHVRLAEKLQKFADPDSGLDRLMVFMPPQHGKSEQCSRMLPGWILGHNPSARIIGCSYNEKLAIKFSRKAKRVIKSEAYRRIFPDTKIPAKHVTGDEREDKRNTAAEWEIVGRAGGYIARGAGQGAEGEPADFILLDDVLSQQMAKSDAQREAVYDWWANTLRARLSSGGKVLIVMTRWHLDDIAGRLLDESREIDAAADWEILKLQAIKEDDGDTDDPREVGEALWPQHKTLEELIAIRETNPDVFEALYQQNPTPPGGTIVKSDHIKRWDSLPTLRGRWAQSWDLRAGGKSKKSSYAVGQLWFIPHNEPANAYLVDQVRGRWDINETIDRILEADKDPLWGRASEKFVEDKADGKAVNPMLSRHVGGMVPVNPGTASKQARLEAVAPFFRAGNVLIPVDSMAPWAREYIHELTNFPGTANDDQVDTTTQALRELLIGPSDDDEHDPYKGWIT